MADKAGAPPRAWQRMLSGRRLDLLDPSPLDIEITDIAHGLARVARWNGQTSGDHAFSVAQHSLLVEEIFSAGCQSATPSAQLAALLHDAPEYVIGDMISPFKAVVGGGYKDCELRLQRAIHMRFALPAEPAAGLRKEIKKADQIAAYFEATVHRRLLGRRSDAVFRPPARRFSGSFRPCIAAGKKDPAALPGAFSCHRKATQRLNCRLRSIAAFGAEPAG